MMRVDVVVPDGFHVEVEDMIPGSCDVIITDGYLFVEQRWTYANPEEAVSAAIAWEARHYRGEEPSEWIRHRPSNRRRRYNDDGSVEEYIAP